MNDILFDEALRAIGTTSIDEANNVVVVTINGYSKPVRRGTPSKVVNAIARFLPVWVINNLGKALLSLPDRHAAPRPSTGEDVTVTADDISCFKAVIGCLGTTVQLAERYVITHGEANDTMTKSLTLRVGDMFYVVPLVEDPWTGESLQTLVRMAVKELMPRIFAKRDDQVKFANDDRKKEARRLKQAEYRAKKKAAVGDTAPSSIATPPTAFDDDFPSEY